jgi:glycogen operon protein
LLPVHRVRERQDLVDKGLTNYWGYNSIGYFAPEAKYSEQRCTGGPGLGVQRDGANLPRRRESSDPRRRLQPHGEGITSGRRSSFRGVDNNAYYWLSPEDQRFYMDFTGTGNTFNCSTRARSSS